MILKGTPATISITFLDGDVPATDPGTVTIGITRADGTVLVAAGTATSGTGSQPRTFSLTTTHTAQVDVLKASWASPTLGVGVTYHPVFGGFYVDLQTLRASGDVSSEAKFTDDQLNNARWWWTDLVDDYCKQSFVPMHRIETKYRLRATDTLLLDRPRPRTILSATLDGAAVDATGWILLRSGEILVTGGIPPTIGPGELTIAYEHGHDQPDRVLYEAGIKAMRGKLLDDRTGSPSRQLIISNAFGTSRVSQPGERRASGIPEVDAVLNRRIGDVSF